MALKITELNQLGVNDFDSDDLLIIYDKVQEKTSTIEATAFRGARFLSGTAAPTRDDVAYIAGDYMLVTIGTNKTLYGPYTVGTISDTAAWGYPAAMSVTPNRMIPTTTILTTDNSLYNTGDYQMVNAANGDNYLIGPYDSDGTSWGAVVNMRGPKAYGTFTELPADHDFSNTYDPIDGDTYIFDGGLGSRSMHTYNGNDWTTAPVISINPTRILDLPSATIDDSTYVEGDWAMLPSGNILGPYSTGQSNVSIAWPVKHTHAQSTAPELTQEGTGVTFSLHLDSTGNLYLREEA